MKDLLASLGLTDPIDWLCMLGFAACLAALGVVFFDALI